VTGRAVYAEQKTITTTGGCRIDPERGVFPMSDKPQLRISQGVCVKGSHGQVPHAGNLLAIREHGAPSHAGTARGNEVTARGNEVIVAKSSRT
jgi:hypothetical protein